MHRNATYCTSSEHQKQDGYPQKTDIISTSLYNRAFELKTNVLSLQITSTEKTYVYKCYV